MAGLIEPRTLKGFRDFLPETMIPRERMMETARQVYRSYGFSPIDTPALEYLEILTGKGSEETDRQMYRFTDHGGREVGMRFDLTVPLARFAAQHWSQLGTPFKRYHIAPVWRGENTQSGRYREFIQCDFDTVGTQSAVADIEMVLVIHDLLRALGVDRFQIRINHRQVLQGLLGSWDLTHQTTPVLRAIDKLEKAGPAKVLEELEAIEGLDTQRAGQILKFLEMEGSQDQQLSQLHAAVAGSESGQAGVGRLQEVLREVAAVGIPASHYRLDLSIARGLDYYTGIVLETKLEELPSIGSICSGGRYDNLAGLYTKQHLPGIGASLGLDRLLAALQELGRIPLARTMAPIFIPLFDPDRLSDYMAMARLVRQAGFGAELYPDAKKLGPQLKYADQKGFSIALIAGSQELDRGVVQVKNLHHQISSEVPWRDDPIPLIDAIGNYLKMIEQKLLA